MVAVAAVVVIAIIFFLSIPQWSVELSMHANWLLPPQQHMLNHFIEFHAQYECMLIFIFISHILCVHTGSRSCEFWSFCHFLDRISNFTSDFFVFVLAHFNKNRAEKHRFAMWKNQRFSSLSVLCHWNALKWLKSIMNACHDSSNILIYYCACINSEEGRKKMWKIIERVKFRKVYYEMSNSQEFPSHSLSLSFFLRLLLEIQ